MNETFLDAYRVLENELKDYNGSSILDFENSLKEGSIEKERLKVCRIMRNYMAHNDTSFIVGSKDQILFLKDLVIKIRNKSLCAKDLMKKPKMLKPSETIKNLVALCDKYDIVPIEVRGKGIYLVDKNILIHNMALGNKKIAIPAKLPVYEQIDKMVRADKISKGTYIVYDKEKYVGILRKD